MEKIIVLGSTGNLGVQMLEILDRHTDKFQLVGLTGYSNSKLLQQQATKYAVPADTLQTIDLSKADIIINLLAGLVGIEPTLKAQKLQRERVPRQAIQTDEMLGNDDRPPKAYGVIRRQGKEEVDNAARGLNCLPKILLANKESLIACPEIILGKPLQNDAIQGNKERMQKPYGLIRRQKSDAVDTVERVLQRLSIIPVDSEHNAIYEILKTRPKSQIKQILLPCSGGPFLGWTREQIANATLDQALAHPRYQMGAKISIESAFLLNKAFEVIEAHILFQIPLEKIRVIIHPECQIHAAVTFETDETLAYIAPPNMREHLENALLDHCNPTRIQPLTNLDFPEPDYPNFPLFHKTIEAYKQGRIKQFLEQEENLIQQILRNEKPLNSVLAL